jgi:hypothetical protein
MPVSSGPSHGNGSGAGGLTQIAVTSGDPALVVGDFAIVRSAHNVLERKVLLEPLQLIELPRFRCSSLEGAPAYYATSSVPP